MSQTENQGSHGEMRKVGIEAESVAGVAELAQELIENGDYTEEKEEQARPEEMSEMFETLVDVYEGLHIATDKDKRGKSRKKVREYAGLEEKIGSGWRFGHILRVFETFGLAEQDGNRWKVADEYREDE